MAVAELYLIHALAVTTFITIVLTLGALVIFICNELHPIREANLFLDWINEYIDAFCRWSGNASDAFISWLLSKNLNR